MYRITNSMLAANYLTNMGRNLRNMQTIQSQLSSGKEINRPSDDPYKASRTMQLYTEIDANKQFNENIKDVSNWLDTTDTALDQAGKLFSRVRELLVSAGNASYGPDEKKAVQDEIKQKVHELSQILNTNFDGAYIFGGTKSTSKPVMVDSNGEIQYANKKGEPINNLYISASGDVVNDLVSNNTKLNQSDAIYLDSNGKITKSATTIQDNGTAKANTKIVSTSSLFVDTGTGMVSTASGRPLLLRDNLYVDAKGDITPSKVSENTLITSDDELFYLTPSGKVTTTYNATYTLIPTGTNLYKDSIGKVTTSSASPNTNIIKSTPLYVDSKGEVTTLSTTANTKLTSSVTGMQVSQYTSGSGYTTTAIANPDQVYIDSRGVLTNSSKTNLSARGVNLKDLWNNSYIDSNEVVKTGTSPSSEYKQLKLYKDAGGYVTTSPGGYPANEQILFNTPLYKDSTSGKVTTVKNTNPIQLTDKVYIDLNGDAIIPNNPTQVDNKLVAVRNDLYVSTVTPNKVTANNTTPASSTLINTSDPYDKLNLYVDSSNNITSNGTGNTKILLGDSLYVDNYGNITNSEITENTLVNSDDKLYQDPNGNVVKSQTNTSILLGTTLYKDSSGRVTAMKGSAPPNEAIDLTTTSLYKDVKGNVTTQASTSGVANTLVDSSKTNLYQDVNGNITTIGTNTSINSDTQLYKLKNASGNVVGVTTTPTGILATTTQLYVDPVSKNVTNIPIGSPATNKLASGAQLYLGGNGNVTTQASTSGVKNTPIPSTTRLYIDPSNQVKTDLIKTGDPLYIDTNGKIIIDKTTTNTELTTKDTVYADAAGYLTMSSTTVNKELNMAGVRNLKSELDNSSITVKRKNEINKILTDEDAIQLAQLDSDLNVEISQGVLIDYNKTASDILEYKDKTGTSKSIVDTLNSIIQNLNSSGDMSMVTGEGLTQVDAIIQNILQKRSEVGAMTNRMESAQSKNEDENLNMTDILSKTEDIDFTEKMMQYSVMQTIYMAALQTSGKILPATLLDYLR